MLSPPVKGIGEAVRTYAESLPFAPLALLLLRQLNPSMYDAVLHRIIIRLIRTGFDESSHSFTLF